MSTKFYFYYVEVSKKGNASDVVWQGSGTGESSATPDEMLRDILDKTKTHAAKSVRMAEDDLCVIIKQFNTL